MNEEVLYDVWCIDVASNKKVNRIYRRLPQFEAEVKAFILTDCYRFNDNGKQKFNRCIASVEPS